MGTIKIDEENNAEQWWDAARTLAARVSDPTFTRVMHAIERGDENMPSSDVEAFVAVARTLPGWDDGPSYARNPVLFSLDDEVTS